MYLDLVFFDDLEVLKKYSEQWRQAFIIAKPFKSVHDLLALKQKISEQKLPFLVCHVLQKSNGSEIQQFRSHADFLAMQGQNLGRNKFGYSNNKIDFVLQPCSSAKPEFDAALCHVAAQNMVHSAVLFQPFLKSSGKERALLLKNYLLVARLCKKYKAPIAFFSGAFKKEELRAAKDFSSFASLLGYSRELSLQNVRKAQMRLKESNKPLVEVVEDEE